MSGTSRSARIERGRSAENVLRHPIVDAAAREVNRRAFELFLSAGNDASGDAARADAIRMVHGALAFLEVLKEWVAEARALTGADADADAEQEHV